MVFICPSGGVGAGPLARTEGRVAPDVGGLEVKQQIRGVFERVDGSIIGTSGRVLGDGSAR
jgi:hypothetical protein